MNIPNDTRKEDLMKEVREYGRHAAEGKDALPVLALRVVRAANDGVIDTTKDKDKRDDANRIYEAYIAAESKKLVHKHTETGLKANVSKVRQIIIMGSMTTCDAVAVLDRAVVLREAMLKAEEKVKPAFASYVDVARDQIAKADSDLSDDEIRAACRSKEPAEKTLEKELQAIQKRLEKIVTGEGGVKDQSTEVIQAEELIRTRLAAMLQRAEVEKAYGVLKGAGIELELAA